MNDFPLDDRFNDHHNGHMIKYLKFEIERCNIKGEMYKFE